RFEADRVDRIAANHAWSTKPRAQGDLVTVHVDTVPEDTANPCSRDDHAVERPLTGPPGSLRNLGAHVHIIGVPAAAHDARSTAASTARIHALRPQSTNACIADPASASPASVAAAISSRIPRTFTTTVSVVVSHQMASGSGIV